MGALRRFGLVSLGLGLLACTSPVITANECERTTDCSGALVCIAGRCTLPGDGGAPTISASELCPQYADAVCHAYATCCDSPMRDETDCRITWQTICTERLGPLLVDERAGYDADQAGRGLVRLEGFAADCSPELADWFAARDGFFGMFAGTISPGSDCTPTSPTDLAAFYSCADASTSCVAATGDRFLCVERVAAGVACLNDFDCQAGLYCDLDGGTGACAVPLPDGSTCTASNECTSRVCRTNACAPRTVADVYCTLVE